MVHTSARQPGVVTQALSMECCHPNCSAPANDRVASQVPLCELHLMDVYKATNALMTAHNPKGEEYALLPMEWQQMPGPCPACGLCGYLAVTVTDKIRCNNASCRYEAWVDEFETLRRRLLFDAAADQDVVYYIKFRDRVKIGTSNNLRQRCKQIVTVELVYGFEPGGVQLEHRRHRQFARYRRIGEWFEDNRQIRAHINNVCSIAA